PVPDGIGPNVTAVVIWKPSSMYERPVAAKMIASNVTPNGRFMWFPLLSPARRRPIAGRPSGIVGDARGSHHPAHTPAGAYGPREPSRSAGLALRGCNATSATLHPPAVRPARRHPMFRTSDAFSSFAVPDIEAARRFYGDTLGLDVRDSDESGLLEIHLGPGAP